MLLTEYKEVEINELFKEEGRAEGRAEGNNNLLKELALKGIISPDVVAQYTISGPAVNAT